MNLIFSILILLIFCYAVFTVITAFAWFSNSKKNRNEIEVNFEEEVSIIIAARNEETTIARCLLSIAKQHYNLEKLEIIVVNDCSVDKTSEEVKKIASEFSNIKITLLELKENKFHKKGALAAGINIARGKIIITRDADTFAFSVKWLSTVVNCFKNSQTKMLICPLFFTDCRSILSYFQLCENYILQIVGGGATVLGFPFLCNGANFAFLKETFDSVAGYEGNLKTASGDDIFLLQKFKDKYPSGIYYCSNKDSYVFTLAEENIKPLLHQKIRWTSKFSKTISFINYGLGISVFLIHFLFLALGIYSLLFFGWYKILCCCILVKWLIDFLLLCLASFRLKQWGWIKWFLPMEIVVIFYSFLVPILSIFVNPVWKQRKI